MRYIFGTWFFCAFIALAGYVTHIIWVIDKLSGASTTMGQLALAILGAVVPPLGAIHGVMLLFTGF